jgi:hypothetical protein
MMTQMVKNSRTKSLAFEGVRAETDKPPDVPDWRGLQAFSSVRTLRISAVPQRLVNHASQGLVNHGRHLQASDGSLTRLFKLKRTGLWQSLSHRPGT